jgi:hypothetical protein
MDFLDPEQEGVPWIAEYLSTTQAIVYVRVLVFVAKCLSFIISLSVYPAADVLDMTAKILHAGRELPHLFSVFQGVSLLSVGGRQAGEIAGVRACTRSASLDMLAE